MYLVDTNVISASAPSRSTALANLTAWLDRNSDDLYLSAVTVAEIETGIAKLRRTGVSPRADHLTAWLETLLHLYSPRILPLDIPVARVLGALTDLARSVNANPGLADLTIAATAISRGYTVLTRNLRHFQEMPVACHDPFASLPPKPDSSRSTRA